jgi:archaellum component FlaC
MVALIVFIVILLIIIIWYVTYPIYFEKYVLMNIPEYRHLRVALNTSEKIVQDTKEYIKKYSDEIEKIKTSRGTPSELLKYERDKVALETRIESYKHELEELTGIVADLKRQLKESHMYVSEMKRIQDEGTKSMKKMNDLLIAEFVLPDKDLARRIQATRDSMIAVLGSAKGVICSRKSIILGELANAANTMRQQSQQYDKVMCDYSDSSIAKKEWARAKSSMIGGPDLYPIRNELSALFDDVESTISYVIQNKFCDKKLKFRVDVFEKYYKDLINGLCESEDWRKATSKQLDYILNKPATYLGEKLN